jgi:photosystem II stability/assembly factor-like uncharacterized protein
MRIGNLLRIVRRCGPCVGVMTLLTCVPPTSPAPRSTPEQHSELKSATTRLEKINEVPHGDGWYKLQLLNAQLGWMTNGKILWRTTDDGATWDVTYSADPAKFENGEIKEFQFFNSREGITMRLDGLHRTQDGGHTWAGINTPLSYPQGEPSYFKFLEDGKVGWIVGGIYHRISKEEADRCTNNAKTVFPDNSYACLEGAVFHTDDGGETWSRQPAPNIGYRIYNLYFSDADHGLALGDWGAIYTENGGRKWEKSELKKECVDPGFLSEYEYRPIAVSFADKLGWISFNDGRLIKSTDGGRTWCDLLQPAEYRTQTGSNSFFQVLHFSNSDHGWALATDGTLYETLDGGARWTKIKTDAKFDDLFFVQPGYGWAVSKAGIYRIMSP